MKPQNFGQILLASGVALIVASFLIPLAMPPGAVWTDAKAESFNRSRAELHNIDHELGHGHAEGGRQQMERQRAEINAEVTRLQLELEGAQHRADWPAWILRGIGCAAVVAGLYVYVRDKGFLGGPLR